MNGKNNNNNNSRKSTIHDDKVKVKTSLFLFLILITGILYKAKLCVCYEISIAMRASTHTNIPDIYTCWTIAFTHFEGFFTICFCFCCCCFPKHTKNFILFVSIRFDFFVLITHSLFHFLVPVFSLSHLFYDVISI